MVSEVEPSKRIDTYGQTAKTGLVWGTQFCVSKGDQEKQASQKQEASGFRVSLRGNIEASGKIKTTTSVIKCHP